MIKTGDKYNLKMLQWRRLFLTTLRVAIGWHFIYEGLSKILAGGWTSYNFLANTSGPFSGFYHFLVSSEAITKVVDVLNICGLISIGLALFIGVFVKYAAISGFLLLSLYYFAYPPFGDSLFLGNEGQLYIVDKNFIEGVALLFIAFAKERGYGIDQLKRLFPGKNSKPENTNSLDDSEESANSRREVLKNLATLPFLGVMGVGAINRHKNIGIDTTSGATIQLNAASLSELKGELPHGTLGDHKISRLILGGNLISGYSHSRDLLYVSSLFKAYNNDKKVFETLMLAEEAGINTICIGFKALPIIAKYKKITGSKMKVIGTVGLNRNNIYEMYDQAMEIGVDYIQFIGNQCDFLVREGKTEIIGKLIDYARSQGYFAGLGAHTLDSLIICEEKGIVPDFYMKTMHHDNYWSAHPRENRKPFEVDGKRHLDHNMFHDNCFCPFPDRTIEFVNRVKVPVIGFKVLAAGAIPPEDGFRWAYENGADFVCAGMFDFQLVNNVNIATNILNDLPARKRKWYA